MKGDRSVEEKLRQVRELMERKGLPQGIAKRARREREPVRGVIVRDTVFPPGYRHGEVLLDDLHGYGGRVFRTLGKGEGFGSFVPHKAVFLDTETTGLAGGAGTYVFLVGIGWFEERGFVVRQFLMPEPSEEREMLLRLGGDLEPFPSVVTFNGGAFDIPLLETRFLMQGLRPSWRWDHHFDLLPVSRRLWRGRFESCRLSRLEEGIVDFRRRGDIPGHAIPELYVRFLRERRLGLLEPVMEHNVWDVVSMAALMERACGIVAGGESGLLEEGWDFASAGGAFAAVDEREASLQCLGAALEHELPGERRRAAARTMASLLKREKRMAEAAAIWEMIRREFPDDYPSRVELAKHYEHGERRPAEALDAAREALRLSRGAGGGRRSEAREKECERRVERLRRRVGEEGR